ncbi:MAG TPA: hypothetical protein VEV61_03560 [Streptosporangiaceae bacterium]|nr:hypothetical protein [Streptosporangiaceae bacterium]
MRHSGTLGKRRGVAVAAAAVAATVAVGLAVPALAARTQSAKLQPATVSRVLGPGQVGLRAAVPWRRVGPGWSLALYSAGHGVGVIKPKDGPSTVYLVDPSGGRYRIITWPAHSAQTLWYLVAWSGDGRRAMFVPAIELYGPREQVFQLQLRTGKVTSFRLPKNVLAVGYTRPDGLNILAERGANIGPTARGTLMRFSLTGHLLKTLATVRGDRIQIPGEEGAHLGEAAYQPAGAELAVGGTNGIVLVGNAGGVIKRLPVPGVNQGCAAVRWWTAQTVLASCSTSTDPGPRLWLVPANGSQPEALTPARTGQTFDIGDFNAWQLSSGRYVNGYGACGTLVIGKQPTHGPEQMVNVPGSVSSLVVNATRTRLQIERINECSPGVSLVWFNPVTRAMTVAIPLGRNQDGVVAVVPYFVTGKF